MVTPRMVAGVSALREVPHQPGTPPREATAHLLALPHGALLLLLVVVTTNPTRETFQTFRRGGENRRKFRPRGARRAPAEPGRVPVRLCPPARRPARCGRGARR